MQIDTLKRPWSGPWRCQGENAYEIRFGADTPDEGLIGYRVLLPDQFTNAELMKFEVERGTEEVLKRYYTTHGHGD